MSQPSTISSVARGELEAHFQDALHAHRQEGLPPEQASAADLADLGNAADVAAGLCTAHLSRGQALLAMLACMVYPLLLALFPTLYAMLGESVSALVQDVLAMIVLIFVLFAFIRLIGFNNAALALPAGVLAFSMILETIDRLASYVLFSRLPLFGQGEGIMWSAGGGLALAMDVAFVFAELLVVGVSWLGIRLIGMEDRLLGLQRPVTILMMLNAPVGAGLVWSIFYGSRLFAGLFSVLGYLVVTILLALVILVFFRAAFRPSGLPLGAA